MEYENGSDAVTFLMGMVIGAAFGAGIALLWAPQSGRRTRRRLRTAMATGMEDAGERFEELSDDVRSAVDTGRRRLRR